MHTITLLVLALLATTFALCPERAYPLTVSTTSGTITGTYYNGSRAFLGIPFAQPPLGALRFAPPVPVSPSSSVLMADQWPNACYQASVTTPVGYTQSEDCLYLNVFTPPCKILSASTLPVMVFIHGGRYWTGYTEQFPGDLLAAKENAVVVSIQYRLSIFGFQSFDNHTNNGLRDQQLALQWVQDNIGVFGGDKSAITIFGESAGASSVLYHLIMPGSYHFYQRAILESTWQWIIPTIEASRQNTATWAAKKGCNNVTAQGNPDYPTILSCLRAQPAAHINPTTGDSNFMVPMVGDDLIHNLPLTSLKHGNYNKLAEIVIGHNYDEGNFLVYSRVGFRTPDQGVPDSTYFTVLNNTLSVYLNQTAVSFIISQYEPVRQQLGNWYGGAQFFGDYYIICGSILAAKYFSAQHVAFKNYIFNYSSPNYPPSAGLFTAASHGNELPYVFLQPIYTPYNFSFTDDVMADRMASTWANFAKFGDSIFSFFFADYPQATYFGSNPFGFFDTRPYTKSICSIWEDYLEMY